MIKLNNKTCLLLTSIFVVFTVAFAQNDYKALTKQDRKDFENAYEAIQTAYKDKNNQSIIIFAPSILDKYKSVLLDPECAKIRKYYSVIANILDSVKIQIVIDSFDNVMALKMSSNDTEYMKTWDGYIGYLKSIKRDSVAYYENKNFGKFVKSFYKNNPGIGSFKLLAGLKYADPKYFDIIKRELEEKNRELFLKLSAQMNIDSIAAFRQKYPGMFTEDVENLFAICVKKFKQSIIRHPDRDAIDKYYSYFPDKDLHIEHAYEFALYTKILKYNDKTDCMEYMTQFPKGKNIEDVKMHYMQIEISRNNENSMSAWQAGQVDNSQMQKLQTHP